MSCGQREGYLVTCIRAIQKDVILEDITLYRMRTLNISISDLEYDKFGLKGDRLSFTELVDIISNELAKQTLNECVALAEKYGLSKMTMDEISAEVKAVRDAKARN